MPVQEAPNILDGFSVQDGVDEAEGPIGISQRRQRAQGREGRRFEKV